MPTGSPPASGGGSPKANGYSLVMVVMIITVMNIVVAIALPLRGHHCEYGIPFSPVPAESE